MSFSTQEVACILAEVFGDDCACNYSGIDEWLPYVCEAKDCPSPTNTTCWEQYLKYKDKKEEILSKH